MALDSYATCPCGSGKKFKWCCQPIHVDIDRAFRQDAEGQHETALKLMADIVAAHPANPEALGRYAQLLYQNDKVEEADATLQRAFDINPNYPFGLLLRGMFRFYEGEFAGALALFRRAAEAYDPQAADQLAQVYTMIADCEMKLNRPLAARAALAVALRCQPDQHELRQQLDAAFGPQSHLPAPARREYEFLSPPSGSAGARSAAWSRALATASSTRLADVGRAFEQLVAELDAQPAAAPGELAAACYNLGIARAWLGDNAGALEALDRYVELEDDEPKAAAAWELGEVLRLGAGMEEKADCREYSVTYQIRDPNAVLGMLQEWERDRRLIGVQANQQDGILTALVLEKPTVITGGVGQPQKLGAYLLLMGQILRFRHPAKESVDRVCEEARQRLAGALSEGLEKVGHAAFADVVLEAVVFPVGVTDKAVAEARIREHAERFFEETWVHRPLRSLNLIPPVDAAGHRTLRKKLRGVIQFLQDCAAGGIVSAYDFDRLRRKLGLLGEAPAAAPPGGAPADIGALGAAELTALPAQELPEEQLEQAYQAALKLDAQDLASRFARELVGRPPRADRPDRAPWYFYLVQRALAGGNTDEALNLVNEGERADCEQNEGRRRNDYELRRGQVHVKRGEADQAQEVFARLIDCDPSNLKTRGTAVEGMLSLRQGPKALKFAEEGLAKARQQNDRDSEQYFLELLAAAKKQGG
jgi:tetratricopeptide (TPR) repeat protein